MVISRESSIITLISRWRICTVRQHLQEPVGGTWLWISTVNDSSCKILWSSPDRFSANERLAKYWLRCWMFIFWFKMEGNKDESEKCIRLAEKCIRIGDKDRAERYLSKALRLYPTKRAEGEWQWTVQIVKNNLPIRRHSALYLATFMNQGTKCKWTKCDDSFSHHIEYQSRSQLI